MARAAEGGQLSLEAAYSNETEVLGIEGRPPIELALAGTGPLGQLDLALTLDAAGERVLTGTTRLRRGPEGLGFTASVEGPKCAVP